MQCLEKSVSLYLMLLERLVMPSIRRLKTKKVLSSRWLILPVFVRKAKFFESTENVLRALRAIERSDIVCVVLNAEEGIQEQDKKIAGYAHEAGKGVVILVNKWDTLEKDNSTYKEFEDKTVKNSYTYLMRQLSLYLQKQNKDFLRFH